MSFDKLVERMNEVATLAKALPAGDAAGAADDKKIKEAAGEEGKEVVAETADDKGAAAPAAGDKPAGDKPADGEAAAAASAADEGEGDLDEEDPDGKKGAGEGEGGEPMSKAFSLTLEDGTVVEAFDGTEMLKSFGNRLVQAEKGSESTKGEFLKAMNVAVDLLSAQAVQIKSQNELVQKQAGVIAEQGTLLKSLQEKVEEIGNAGRGRQSTVTAHEKPGADGALAKAMDPNAMTPAQILVKAQGALKAGRITGVEASGIETRLNLGLGHQIDPEVLAKIQ